LITQIRSKAGKNKITFPVLDENFFSGSRRTQITSTIEYKVNLGETALSFDSMRNDNKN